VEHLRCDGGWQVEVAAGGIASCSRAFLGWEQMFLKTANFAPRGKLGAILYGLFATTVLF
jgi:hypothetical protein